MRGGYDRVFTRNICNAQPVGLSFDCGTSAEHMFIAAYAASGSDWATSAYTTSRARRSAGYCRSTGGVPTNGATSGSRATSAGA